MLCVFQFDRISQKRFLGTNDTKHTNMTETDDERKRGEMVLKKLKSANEKLQNACLFGDRLLLEEAITDLSLIHI